MPTTITASSGTPATTSPTLVLGYEATRDSSNKVHRLIGGGVAAVVALGSPRHGTLRLFYPSRASAFESANMHARPATFSLTDTDLGQIEMIYVLAEGGRATVALDENRAVWVVTVDFQELS